MKRIRKKEEERDRPIVFKISGKPYAIYKFYRKVDSLVRDKNTKSVRPRGVDSAKVIQVVETKALRGNGTEGDPFRYVIQYWSFDGYLLAEKDPKEDEAGIESSAINVETIIKGENALQNLNQNKKNPYAAYGI